MGRPSIKSQLIERTFMVFLAKGYEGASVNDLVAAANVPKGSFYNHFPSKEALAIEHVRRYVEALELDRLAESDASPFRALREHFERRIAARTVTGLENGCLLGNFSTGVPLACGELRAAVDEGFTRWRAAIAALLRRAQAQGELDSEVSVDELASYLIGALEGAIASARVSAQPEHVTGFMDITFGRVLPHLTTSGEQVSRS
jgi:TetR/AcrR family transcriptional repressor of nem operon